MLVGVGEVDPRGGAHLRAELVLACGDVTGAVKQSGWGRRGHDGIREFNRPKNIHVALWPEFSVRLLKALIR
jgi:hypothetical protein